MALSAGEATAIGIGLGNIVAWSKLIYDARKNGKNGNGKFCAAHGIIESRLSAINAEKEAFIKELKTLHDENRQDHGAITSEIKSLAVAVATASEAARTASAAAAAAAASSTFSHRYAHKK